MQKEKAERSMSKLCYATQKSNMITFTHNDACNFAVDIENSYLKSII